jgi:hypothetical protein
MSTVVSLAVHVFCNIFYGKYVKKWEAVKKLPYWRHDYIIVFVFYHHGEPQFLSPYSDRLYVAEQGLIPRLLIHYVHIGYLIPHSC